MGLQPVSPQGSGVGRVLFWDIPTARNFATGRTILFAHIAMDRFFGYGLKYEKGFAFTHLGEVGEANKRSN